MNEKAVNAQQEAWTVPLIITSFITNTAEAHYQAARWLIEKEGIITHLESDTIYFYNRTKGIYEKKGRTRIKEILTRTFTQYAKRHAQAEIINHVANLTLKEGAEFEKHISKNMIPVKNGLVNIETGALEPYNKRFWYTHQLPITYNPDASCDKIDEFFKEIVEEKDVTRLYDIFALSMYFGYILEKFYILDGSGANGKSRVLKILERFVGQENTSTVSLKQLTEDPFAPANTHNKLVNYGADIGSRPIYDTAFLKNYTGGDRITVQFKNKQHFDMLPTALLIFSSNKPPCFMDDSDGMYRRPEIITFPYKFGNEADRKENPEIKPADPNIVEKVTDEDELSGLFNRALKHLQNIIKDKSLSVQQSTKQLRKEYLRMSNSVHAFVDECCEPADYNPAQKDGDIFIPAEGCISNEEFFLHYSKWCEAEGLNPERPAWIGKRLKDLSGWYLEVGLQDHYEYWNNKKKGIRGLRISKQSTKPANTADNNQTRQTRHSTIMEVVRPNNSYNKDFAVFAVSEEPIKEGVLSSTNTAFNPTPKQTRQINDSRGVLDFLQEANRNVPTQELIDACPHKNAETFILEVLKYHVKRGDVFNPKPDEWRAL